MATWMTGATFGYQINIGFLAAVVSAVSTGASKAGVAFVSKAKEGQAQVEVKTVNPKIGSTVYLAPSTVLYLGPSGDCYPI